MSFKVMMPMLQVQPGSEPVFHHQTCDAIPSPALGATEEIVGVCRCGTVQLTIRGRAAIEFEDKVARAQKQEEQQFVQLLASKMILRDEVKTAVELLEWLNTLDVMKHNALQ